MYNKKKISKDYKGQEAVENNDLFSPEETRYIRIFFRKTENMCYEDHSPDIIDRSAC